MLFIRDYGNLNALVSGLTQPTISGLLSSLKGKAITVFTESGGQSGGGFTGLLLAVGQSSIQLLTKRPCTGRNVQCFKGQKKNVLSEYAVIPLDHIVAVTYKNI